MEKGKKERKVQSKIEEAKMKIAYYKTALRFAETNFETEENYYDLHFEVLEKISYAIYDLEDEIKLLESSLIEIDSSNYFKYTFANFKFKGSMKIDPWFIVGEKHMLDSIMKKLKRIYPNSKIEFNYNSHGLSFYFIINDKTLVRISDHWSNRECLNIRSCWWEIKNINKKVTSKFLIGEVDFKNMVCKRIY